MARRKKYQEEPENHERWLVSYADFITLLFAFFVVLYATSEKDNTKTKDFEKSIQKYLLKVSSFGGAGGQAVGPKKNEGLTIINSPLQRFQRVGNPRSKKIQKLQKQIEVLVESKMTAKERRAFIRGITDEVYGVRLVISAKSIFPENSDRFKRSSIPALNKLGQLIKEIDKKVMIEGHSDNIPLKTSKFPSVWELTSLRSTKLLRYFMAQHKVDDTKLVSMSYGPQKPIAPNNSVKNREMNNRIEFLVLTDDYL